MKFCYFDESGNGDEPYLVIAGIIVDAHRMHVTKEGWADFLAYLSKVAERPIQEFHSRDFYRGNGIWREMGGPKRAEIIDAIINWVVERKHKSVFSGIDKKNYKQLLGKDERLNVFKTMWCAASMHCTLQVQKQHQNEAKTKGHTVLIFDREVAVEKEFSQLIFNPPLWTDSYYLLKRRQSQLNQIVDVPFFADSKHILLAQVADLFAYILRTSAEIQDGLLREKFEGEGAKMLEWSNRIAKTALPRATRYPSKSRCKATQLFWDLAPLPIKSLKE
jgi:hypothetical protein